ncbi:MAG: hypothetical protein HWE21_05925 [Cytophagia bacterium]|nr:hypothetical protein [Cytophagia bacterium]NVK83839.1 hypothetical protein [Cytophagia bacterium]
MLIGKQTPLNDTLQEVLSSFVPEAIRVSPEDFIAPEYNVNPTKTIVFVNLTDLTDEEGTILKKIKESPVNRKVIGIHTFMVPAMKEDVLKKGYDGYLSFFEFSEKIEDLLNSF